MARSCPRCGAEAIPDPNYRGEPPVEYVCSDGCDDEEPCSGCGRRPSDGIGCSACPGYNGQDGCTGRSDCDCPQHQADDEEALVLYSYEVLHGHDE